MQNVSTMIRRPVAVGTAVAGGFLGLMVGAVIALAVPAVLTGVSVTNISTGAASTSAVGAQQISHNRSEQGFGASVSGQQIAHNRSEEGLGN
jgi:hypothetical protein